jgi:hypothetical protein
MWKREMRGKRRELNSHANNKLGTDVGPNNIACEEE